MEAEQPQYDVLTREELESGHYDPETIKVIRELKQESNNAHTSTAESKGTVREIKKMTSIKEAAQQYEPKHTKNITELPELNIDDMQLEDREGTDKDGKQFNYKIVIVGGEEYRVPGSVIGGIKGILEKKPTLKRISVSKTGEGLATQYTVIPLE